MSKTANEYVYAYKALLGEGDIQIAYEYLLKYMLSLKTEFAKKHSDRYSAGNVSPGYLDFSYFPIFNDFLRKKELRFGIVLNHRQMQFELWLMGKNADVQRNYWDLLKETKWNIGRTAMPKYSVLETTLVNAPDFDDTDALSASILNNALTSIEEILPHLL